VQLNLGLLGDESRANSAKSILLFFRGNSVTFSFFWWNELDHFFFSHFEIRSSIACLCTDPYAYCVTRDVRHNIVYKYFYTSYRRNTYKD
jgi:hypothetical protein